MKVSGRNGACHGQFSVVALRSIKALALQEPATERFVPDLYYINSEGTYHFPERFGALTHQILAADALGDDGFIEFVADNLKVSSSRLNLSHSTQAIRRTVRDRMRLKEAVPALIEPPLDVCYKCKVKFTQQDAVVEVACCARAFHRTCLEGVFSCPFCTVAWGSCKCVKCRRHTMAKDEREPHFKYKTRRYQRMTCCGVDVHPQCERMMSLCPQCGVSTQKITSETFVYLRMKERKNEAKPTVLEWSSTLSPLFIQWMSINTIIMYIVYIRT